VINVAGVFSWHLWQWSARGLSQEWGKWASGMVAEATGEDDNAQAHEGSDGRSREGSLKELLLMAGQVDLWGRCSSGGGEPGPMSGGWFKRRHVKVSVVVCRVITSAGA